MVLTLTTFGALSSAALLMLAFVALMQRYANAPIGAAQGTSVPNAAATPSAVAHQTTVDRKADGRVPPRGRPL